MARYDGRTERWARPAELEKWHRGIVGIFNAPLIFVETVRKDGRGVIPPAEVTAAFDTAHRTLRTFEADVRDGKMKGHVALLAAHRVKDGLYKNLQTLRLKALAMESHIGESIKEHPVPRLTDAEVEAVLQAQAPGAVTLEPRPKPKPAIEEAQKTLDFFG